VTPTRRDFLAAAAVSAATGAVASSLSASPVNRKPAKSCIFLHLVGGPSQLDTFDPKPMAPSDVRGPFKSIQTAVPGVHVSELFPRLSGMMNDVSMIRTLHHNEAPIHENGFQLLHTGRRYGDGPAWPGAGAVVSHFYGQGPPWRDDRAETPWWQFPKGLVNTGIEVDRGMTSAHLHPVDNWFPNGINEDDHGKPIPFRILADCAMMAAKYGARFVNLNMYTTVFDSVSWDCHAAGGSLNTTLDDYRETVCPIFDYAFEKLIDGLKYYDLFDQTLVIAVGEFGRTPKLNAQGGRDHWPGCWTALLAGGGIKGGRVIGESDATASAPKDRPVTCPELLATIYHALGIPSTTMMPGPFGAPVRVVEASPVLELF
jgi:hypothetical protein